MAGEDLKQLENRPQGNRRERNAPKIAIRKRSSQGGGRAGTGNKYPRRFDGPSKGRRKRVGEGSEGWAEALGFLSSSKSSGGEGGITIGKEAEERSPRGGVEKGGAGWYKSEGKTREIEECIPETCRRISHIGSVYG